MDVDAITQSGVTSVAELIDLAESFEQDQVRDPKIKIAFRGQPQEFRQLTPSFCRQFSRNSVGTAEIIERTLIKEFRKHYANLVERSSDMPSPVRIGNGYDLRCLSVMQHYEIQTRLLDWTSSFWTAVYFATASDPDSCAELWYYDRRLFSKQVDTEPSLVSLLNAEENVPPEPEFLSRRNDQLLVELDPSMTPRMKKQSAHHTVSTNVFADHAPLLFKLSELARTSGDDEFAFKRIIIQNTCKGKVLQFLAEHKEITASSIFPDVVGLGRFLRWQLESLRTMML